MSIHEHAKGLRHDWSRLAHEWDGLCRVWHDTVRKDFERRYMTILHDQAARTLLAMEALSDEVDAAQKVIWSCQDSDSQASSRCR